MFIFLSERENKRGKKELFLQLIFMKQFTSLCFMRLEPSGSIQLERPTPEIEMGY